MAQPSFIFEDAPAGRSLVVTGTWSPAAADTLSRRDADGLVLNYARGFTGPDLNFLDAAWGLRRLKLLDRSITDLAPIARLGESLEALSVRAAPRAELDLGSLRRLHVLAGEWSLIGPTLGDVGELQDVVTWRFDEVDLHAFRDLVLLRRLIVKDAPVLESLNGVGNLPDLENLGAIGAPRLHDISDAAGLSATLLELELEDCLALEEIDDVESLHGLRFLGVSECGDIASLAPLSPLDNLEVLYAFGTTRISDGDLSPLTRLPRLAEIRIQDRPSYRPRVATIRRLLAEQGV
jgi:hypothetical protein